MNTGGDCSFLYGHYHKIEARLTVVYNTRSRLVHTVDHWWSGMKPQDRLFTHGFR